MSKLFYNWILSLDLCIMLFSCSNTKGQTLPNPEIKEEIAKVSGKITNFHPYGNKDCRMLTLRVMHPVTAEVCAITNGVNEDGVFAFEVPMQCDYAIGHIRPEFISYDEFEVCLTSGKETKMEIIYGETTGSIQRISLTDSLGLTSTDLMNISKLRDKLISYSSPELVGTYAKTSDEFVQRAKIGLNDRLKKIDENKTLSENAKNYLANEMKLLNLYLKLLRCRENMHYDYINAGNKDVEKFNPPEPDKKYYKFLKDYDLNNPQYLYQGYYYSEVSQMILSNDALNIHPVGDTPVDQWMKDVKTKIAELVGFDKGLFYDMLAANSYARQFNNELRPLSDKQKANITNYFKDDKGEIAKMLIKKNDEIVRLSAQKEPVVVNKTPKVSKGELMDAIVSKYKGKVVVFDFWATWCGPCLDTMEKYRTVKNGLKGKDVVFVYITNTTSPQKLWEEKIQGIGGEHYYLKNEEWMDLMNTFQFNAIPSYVIFDKKGEARDKFTAYPGNEKMQAMIEELLK